VLYDALNSEPNKIIPIQNIFVQLYCLSVTSYKIFAIKIIIIAINKKIIDAIGINEQYFDCLLTQALTSGIVNNIPMLLKITKNIGGVLSIDAE
jgi:hypothetical protein